MEHEKKQMQHTAAAAAAAANVEFIMRCMDNGRSNNVTRLLLHQAILDVDRNGLALSRHFAWFKRYSSRSVDAGHYVPVLARSVVSRHSWMQPPMAGRLPLINEHNAKIMRTQQCCAAGATNMCNACRRREASSDSRSRPSATGTHGSSGKHVSQTSKRRRMQSPQQTSEASPIGPAQLHYGGAFVVLPHRNAASSSSIITASDDEETGDEDDDDEDEGPWARPDGHSTGSTMGSSSRPSISTQSSMHGRAVGSAASSISPATISLAAAKAAKAAAAHTTMHKPTPMPQHVANSFYSSMDMSNVCNGHAPSGAANTNVSHDSFMTLPHSNIAGPSASHPGDGNLPMSTSFMFSSLGETSGQNGSPDDAAAMEAVLPGDDAWTSFLQAGDYDSTDWAAIDHQS